MKLTEEFKTEYLKTVVKTFKYVSGCVLCLLLGYILIRSIIWQPWLLMIYAIIFLFLGLPLISVLADFKIYGKKWRQ